MSYRTNRHSCYDLEYHLVVVTKYRHPVIDGAFKGKTTQKRIRRIPCSVLLETLSLESFLFCLHCE